MTDDFTAEQDAALRRVRLYWWGAIAVIAPLPFVILPLTGAGWLDVMPKEAYPAADRFNLLMLVLAAATAAAGWLARNQAYKRDWQGDAVTPAGYVRGNRLFFSCLAVGAVVVALAGVAVGYPAPTFAAAPVYIGLLIFNRPHGRPMQPQPPNTHDTTTDHDDEAEDDDHGVKHDDGDTP